MMNATSTVFPTPKHDLSCITFINKIVDLPPFETIAVIFGWTDIHILTTFSGLYMEYRIFNL